MGNNYDYIPDGYWNIWEDKSSKNPYTLGDIGEYLSEFSLEATPTMDLGSEVGIKTVQFALNKLGFKDKNKKTLAEDGAWGANTLYALTNYILQSKKKYPSANAVRDGNVVEFIPSEVGNQLIATASMSDKGRQILAAKPAPKGAAKPVSKPVAKAAPKAVAKPVANAKAAPKAVAKPVANAKAAPKAVAKPVAKTAPKSAAKAAPKSAAKPLTKAASKVAAKPVKAVPKVAAKPAAKSVAPSMSGLMKISVGAAQDILNKLGAKLKRDGLFGANTAKAWATAALAKKAATAFDRAAPMEAWVDPRTLEILSGRAGASAQAVASDAPPPSAEPTTIAPPAPVQAPAVEQLAAAQVVKQAITPVSVLSLQQAELMANKTPAQAGRYVGVEETGSWDEATERGFYILFGIKAPYDGVWKIALANLVSGSSVLVLPKQAADINALSQMWLAQKNKPEQTQTTVLPPEQTEQQQQVAAPSARIAEVVGRSTTILPVKVLQQALRQLFDLQQAGKIPASPAIPLPQVTGSWRHGVDDIGLLLGWGAQLYPYGEAVPPEDKEAILSKILFSAPGLSGLRGLRGLSFRGLRGFGAIPEGNAIKLPPEIIANIQSLASDYVAKTAQNTLVPTDAASSAMLIPPSGSQMALEPQLITGQVPQQATQSQTPVYAPQQSQTPVYAPMPYQDQIQAPAPIMLTPNYPTPSTNYFTVAPTFTANTAVAPSAEPSIPTAANLPTPGAPALPSAAAASTPSSASGIGIFLGLLGVGTLAVLALKGKDSKRSAA